MKILQVSIKNLNSLQAVNQQPQIIDFRDKRIAEEGLFAIVGSTGAGKTTILDAITLALYGQTARKHQKDVMTYGTTDCFAEVEFKVKNKEYRAKWYQSRKTVESKIYTKHEIATLPQNDIISGHKIKETQYIIKDIIGLTFEQFTRAVMLVQGDFAKFLNANKNEKVELLEKMTGTERYSKISTKAFEKNDEEKQKLAFLEEKLTGLSLLTTEDIQDFNIKLEQSERQIQNLNKAAAQTNKQIDWLEILEQLSKKESELNEISERLQNKQEAQQTVFDLLVLHDKAVGFEGKLKDIKRLREEIENLDSQLIKQSNNLETLVNRFLGKKGKYETATQAFEVLKASEVGKNALFETVIVLDNDIASKAKPIAKSQSDLIIENKNLADLNSNLATVKTTLVNRQNRQEKAEKWLSENQVDENIKDELSDIKVNINIIESQQEELDKATKTIQKETITRNKTVQKQEKTSQQLGKINTELITLKEDFIRLSPNSDNLNTTIDEVENSINFGQKSINDLKDFVRNAEQFNVDNDTFKQIQNDLLLTIENQSTLKVELEKLQLLIPVAIEKRDDKTRLYELEQRMQGYEDVRKSLKEGDKCPVCFSTEHNFDFHYDISKTEKEKKEAEKALNQLQQNLTTCKANLKNANQNYGNQQSSLQQIEVKIKRFDAVLNTVSIENKRLFNSNSGIHGLKDKLNSLESLLKDEREKLKQLRKLNSKITKLNQSKVEKTSELKQGETSLKHSNQIIENNTITQENCRTKRDNYQQILNTILEKYQLNAVTEGLIDTLQNRAKTFKNAIDFFENNTHKIELLKQEIKTLESQQQEDIQRIETLTKEVKIQETELQELNAKRMKLFGTQDLKKAQQSFKNQLVEKEQLINKLREEVGKLNLKMASLKTSINEKNTQKNKLSNDLELITDNLQKAITKKGFVNFEAVQNALLSDARKTEIETTQKKLHEARLKNQQSLDDIGILIKKESNKKLTEENKKILLNKLHDLKLEQKELTEQVGKIKKELDIDAINQEKAAAQKLQIDKQRAICKRWKNLNDLIGSKNGKKFQVFVQHLTLNQLVILANKHLRQLNTRYYLEKDEEKHDTLDLFVIDTHQANTRRPMTTLSGGESFLVSLALALGLSDLAGQNTNIESLFIDEGFGTLDEATLQDAILTLKNLNHSGKTIGIISHVSALKREITTKIQVMKKGGGVSVLKLC